MTMTSQEGQHATFAGADIRGVDFRNQRLVGADFDGARGGVSKWWMIGCGAGALLAALLAGTLVGAGSSAPPVAMIAPPDQTGVWRQVVLPLLGLLILTALFALLLWQRDRRSCGRFGHIYSHECVASAFL